MALECIWTIPLPLANPRWLANAAERMAEGELISPWQESRSETTGAPCMTSDERIGTGNGDHIMKLIGITGTAALFLMLGIGAPANARQERQQEKAKPAQQQQQTKPEKQQAQAPKPQQQRPQQQTRAPQQAKPEKQQQQAQAPKQEQQAKPQRQQQAQAPKQQQRQQEQARTPKQEQQAKPQRQVQSRGQQQQNQQQARSSHAPQRTQQAQARQRSQPALRLSERGSGRIPDERFHSNFGREHHFHVGNPVLVGGYSRFQYGGFWFGFVEPWPEGWYYTDDVYIDYADGGYYMYDPYYPGARFAISVVI